MRRLKQAAAVAGIVLVAAVALLALIAAFPAGRSALVGVALRALVWQRGYHMIHGTIVLAHNMVRIDDARIADRRGELFLTVRTIVIDIDPAGLIGRSDRAFGVRKIVVVEPRIFLIRHEDGTWNFYPLLPPPAAAPARGARKPGLPLRLTLLVRDGTITVFDPQAVVVSGKTFSIDGIQTQLALNQGAISVGALRAILRTTRGDAPLQAKLDIDDSVGFGRTTIDAQAIPIAPIVDAFAPTTAFVAEGGVADVHMLAYMVGGSGEAQTWHVSGTAAVRIARMRIVALAVPVRDVRCELYYHDGLLSTPVLVGTAAGVPLRGKGAVQIKGRIRLAFAAQQQGRLERERALFGFSKNQPVSGPFSAAMRVDGYLNDIHINGSFHLHDARYAGAMLPKVDGLLYYDGGHLTVSALDLDYAGARLWLGGDFDLGHVVSTTLLLAGSAPSRTVPFAANLVPQGTMGMLATVEGPLNALSAAGYARLAGSGTTAQTFFNIDPHTAFYGPMLVRTKGGQVFVAARVVHGEGAPPFISGVLVATHASVAVRGGRVAFADMGSLGVSLPSLDTTLDGVAVINGEPGQPALALDARASHLYISGIDMGDATLRAMGSGGHVHLIGASLRRPGLMADAGGDLVVTPRLTVSAAALRGTGSLDLAALRPLVPRLAPAGRASGRFAVVMAGSQYELWLQAHGNGASVDGLPLRGGSVTLRGQGATTSVLADVGMPSAHVLAAGDVVRGSTDAAAHLTAFSPQLQLAALPRIGARLRSGTAIGFATVDGNMAAPRLGAAAAVRTAYDGMPIDGDVDVRYNGSALRSNASRVSLGGSRATVTGDVRGLSNAASANALSLDVNIDHGDLAGIDRFAGPQAPLTGAFDAQMHVGGSLATPQLSGNVVSPLGTIRGVTFNDVAGRVTASQQSASLHGGTLQLGSSRFALDGNLSRGAFNVQARSPQVDLTDFNDFFGGKDVFAGKGDFNLDVGQSAGAVAWGGRFELDDAAFSDYPLGHIDADFFSRRGSLRAVVHQNGSVGTATVSGSARFHSNSAHLPDLGSASYRVRARLRNLDVAAVLPLLHREDLGLSGRLDADGRMTGTLHNPIGNATFTLHDGRMQRVPIESLNGTLTSDIRGVTLSHGNVAIPYLAATVNGRYTFKDEQLAGHAVLSAADLAAVATAMKVPGALGGSATADVTLSGTLKRPQAALSADAGRATIYGIAFDRAKINATYAPGAVGIGDTELTFAGARGTLSFAGELPLQLQPLALGPKNRPIELTMRANKIDLSILNPIIGRYATLAGNLNAGASISGSAGNPLGKGTAQIRYATVHSNFQGVPLTDVNADLGFDQDTITLRGLSGKAGSGTFTANGSAHIVPAVGLRSTAGLQFSSHLALRGAQVDVPGWIRGTLDGDLSMTRSGQRPYVEGSVAVQNTVIPFSAIYDLATGGAATASASAPQQAPGVPPLHPGHTIVYGGSAWGAKETQHVLTSFSQPTPAPTGFSLPPVDVNVAVTAGNNVRVRGGSAIDLTTAGGVVVAGSLQAPTLDGQFYAVRGQVGYFDTNFRLVSGTVTFDHEAGLLPTMDVTAVTNAPGAQITLRITGRVDNLNTELSSNPSMSRDQIVATLLHAPQIASLTSPTPAQAQSTLTQTAQNYFNAQLSRSLLYPFESALAQQLNIESVSFIFNSAGKLAVEFRTRVTPTISAVYQTTLEVPVTQSYGASYNLRDYLSLDLVEDYPNLSESSINTTTLNLRYQFH